MKTELEFEIPTWNQIYTMLLNLADKIRGSKFKPDIIVGVCRGGWPPARVLSDLLDNANLANVRAEFYVGVAETKREAILTQPVSFPVKDKRVLIVDEVADTGKSLKLVKDHITQQGAAEAKTAAVYYKPWSIIKPDYYEKETSRWRVVPWGTRETIKRLVKRCKETNTPIKLETGQLVKAGLRARRARGPAAQRDQADRL